LKTSIRALTEHTVATHFPGATAQQCRAEGFKLYVRDRALLQQLRESIAEYFPADAPLLILEGDVCRRELLVEVEGSYEIIGDRPQLIPSLVRGGAKRRF